LRIVATVSRIWAIQGVLIAHTKSAIHGKMIAGIEKKREVYGPGY
jgi:hypothetical protein